MPQFQGFSSAKADKTAIPAQFFTELLAEVDTVQELKVTLYVFWLVSQMESPVRFFSVEELESDTQFMQGLGKTPRSAKTALLDGLERAVLRGTFLKAVSTTEQDPFEVYLVNTPKGRAAVQGLQEGKWHPSRQPKTELKLEDARPTIYSLYEDNYGPLTPMIAEMLRDAAERYPMDWIEEAVRESLAQNVRSWKYTAAILKRWEEGE